MRKLEVYIEEDGDFVLAGHIQGETWEDARFIYEKSYLEIKVINRFQLVCLFRKMLFAI